MRRIRRDLCVTARCVQRPICQWRVVVGVDDVVGYSRVLWLLCEQRLEYGAGLSLVDVGLVFRGRGGEQRQRVKDGSFMILGIARLQMVHSRLVSPRASTVVQLVGVPVKRLDGGDIVSFTLRFRAGRVCSFESCLSSF